MAMPTEASVASSRESDHPTTIRRRRWHGVVALGGCIVLVYALVALVALTTIPQDHLAENGPGHVNLRKGITAALTYWDEHESYLGFGPNAARAIEPSLSWVMDGEVPEGVVSIVSATITSSTVLLLARNPSGAVLCIWDEALPPYPPLPTPVLDIVNYGVGRPWPRGVGTSVQDVDTGAECLAAEDW
jgi:hypothetical protein